MEEREREDTVNSEEVLISIPLAIETFFSKSERRGSEVGGKYVRTSPYPDGFSVLFPTGPWCKYLFAQADYLKGKVNDFRFSHALRRFACRSVTSCHMTMSSRCLPYSR